MAIFYEEEDDARADYEAEMRAQCRSDDRGDDNRGDDDVDFDAPRKPWVQPSADDCRRAEGFPCGWG